MAKDALDIAVDYIYAELGKLGGDPEKLPEVQRPVAILYNVQAVIDNGGFQYLFEQDYPGPPSYAVFVEAYRTIGATNAADCLEKAVALFPFENPHLDYDKRLEFLETLPETHAIFQLGDMVCGDKSVWALLNTYVLERPLDFLPSEAAKN